MERVKKSIEQAKTKSKDIKHLGKKLEFSDWETIAIQCTVCGNDGTACGYTEEQRDEDGLSLEFYCESFKCDECGPQLEDKEEMSLAGFETVIDRYDDCEKWEEDNYESFDYEY